MAQWGNLDAANNAPKWKSIATGSSIPNRGNTVYANTTIGAFINNETLGVFGTDVVEAAALPGNGTPGWTLTRVGTGYVTGLTVSGGSGFANGDSLTISNGSSNGTATLTTNATGNLVSASIGSGGTGFVNTTMVVIGFNREQHLGSVSFTGTANGYSNTDTIRVSNGTINATANVTTNATGGSLTFTVTSLGRFANTLANNQLVVTALSNTGANSAGTGATFTANLVTSTGGTANATSLGGHAGRIFRETLVVVKQMANNTNSGGGSTSP